MRISDWSSDVCFSDLMSVLTSRHALHSTGGVSVIRSRHFFAELESLSVLDRPCVGLSRRLPLGVKGLGRDRRSPSVPARLFGFPVEIGRAAFRGRVCPSM